MSEIDFNTVEERFFSQEGDQLLAIDEQNVIVDDSL
jgi:hypothetical protein